MFYYTAFGLNIASEFEFPELLAIERTLQPDVRIRFGTTPKTLKNATYSSSDFWLSPTQCLQHIDKVGYYYAENGNHIIVEPYPMTDMKSMRIYLLCSSMAAIIHQIGCIPLHASGILINESIALFIGDTGAGKSTTIKALSKKGHTIFTDDVCVLRIHDRIVEGVPSYPVMKLWQNSFRLLGLGTANVEDKLWRDVEKFGLYFHDQFVSKWKPINKIFILEKDEHTNKVRIEKQTGVEAFIALGSNTYRGWYIEPMSLNELHFTIINQLLNQCKVYKIIRPSELETIFEITEIIEKELKVL